MKLMYAVFGVMAALTLTMGVAGYKLLMLIGFVLTAICELLIGIKSHRNYHKKMDDLKTAKSNE